jgi:hypothetical protein
MPKKRQTTQRKTGTTRTTDSQRRGKPNPDQVNNERSYERLHDAHERVNVAPTPPKKQGSSGQQGGSGSQQTPSKPEASGDSGGKESSEK